jgi:hypothetical protein
LNEKIYEYDEEIGGTLLQSGIISGNGKGWTERKERRKEEKAW